MSDQVGLLIACEPQRDHSGTAGRPQRDHSGTTAGPERDHSETTAKPQRTAWRNLGIEELGHLGHAVNFL